MNIIADTNILVRAITGDDPRQSLLAQNALAGADLIALPLPTLCELVWVLTQGYKTPAPDIIRILRQLIQSDNVATHVQAAEAGLAMLEDGGDFADGVIAYDGAWLGGETFVSFDKKAVKRLAAQGHAAQLLA